MLLTKQYKKQYINQCKKVGFKKGPGIQNVFGIQNEHRSILNPRPNSTQMIKPHVPITEHKANSIET